MKKLLCTFMAIIIAASSVGIISAQTVELLLKANVSCSDSITVADPDKGQRMPNRLIRCLITPTGVTLTPAIDDSEILSFDIYVDDMPVASFDDEADFCAFIFSYTGTAEIRLHTTEHTLAGFITL